MKKLILLVLPLLSLTVLSQTDTSNLSELDTMSPDELLQYYINEKEPVQFYKGPEKIGDSVYNIINPLTIPTKTVYADGLFNFDLVVENGKSLFSDSSNSFAQKLKPKIALGVGRLGFYGDLYKKHFQSPLTARPAVDLNISQRLTPYLQLNFTVLFGKLGANERQNNRQENFYSEIRAGGVNLLYDFGNFIPLKYAVRPFVSFGVMGFEFLSKTDLKDRNGNTYYYWSDGSIKNMAEGSANAQYAIDLKRDYVYETDIRERNLDGFGKYPERAWAFPIGIGSVMKVTDRIDFKLNFQYFITTTDYIDGISSKSIGNRVGGKGKDKFTYTSISLQYDLIAKNKPKQNPLADTLNNSFWLAFDNEDRDKDGVIDMKDNCQGTPEGVKVDVNGCPLDDDLDGIPNYRDDELATAAGVPVNEKGVGQTDEYWQKWYADYLNDSLSNDKTTEYVGNFFAKNIKPKKKNKNTYTVELARYKGGIPPDELAFLFSIGDVNSKILEDGTTVVYTTGNYDKVSAAIARRDKFKLTSNKPAIVSRVTDNNIEQISEQELAKLLEEEAKAALALNGNNKQDGTNTELTNNNTSATNSKGVNANNTKLEVDEQDFSGVEIIYRVQLGAFRNKISTSVFNTSAGVLELQTGENIYRYVTRGFKTIEEAASVRADLVLQGYSDAFVTSYKEGKRIALSKTKATVDKSFKEDLDDSKMFSSVDKKLVSFKVQLGPLKKASLEATMDAKVKDLATANKQTTTTGSIRYTSGVFNSFDAAEKHRKELDAKGFVDAFIIATFKNEIISIQEALELLAK